LLRLGLEPGDRVAILAYNCIEWMEIYIALAKAGLVAVPVNFRLLASEIQYIAEHSSARALHRPGRARSQVEGASRTAGDTPQRGSASAAGRIRLDRLRSAHRARAGRRADVALRPTDPWALMYTSGTTGKPKGAIRNHEGWRSCRSSRRSTWACPPTTRRCSSCRCATRTRCTSAARSPTSARRRRRRPQHFDPEALLATIASQRITFTSLVPTHYIMALGLPSEVKARYDVSRIRKLMISSAPARKDTKLAILEYFRNSQLYELYGSTEAGWVTLLRPDEQIEHLGSVGREWTGSGPVKIVDPYGKEVADGEVGELFSCTPYNVRRLLQRSREDGRIVACGRLLQRRRPRRRDEHGFIHLVDRKSNMIISGGENIYPSEIENLLGAYPGVKDVAAVGIPHELWGEAVHAVIVMHAGATADEKHVLDWCRDKVAGYKRPRSVSFIAESEMPRTATGKIQHRVLRGPVRQAEDVTGRSEQHQLSRRRHAKRQSPTSAVAALGPRWWLVLLRGIAAIVFGILAWAWPGATLITLTLFWGAYALVDGIAALWSCWHARDRGKAMWQVILIGVAGIAAGIFTFVAPGITAIALLLLIAVWAVVNGVFQIAAAIQLRKEIANEWLLILSGALSVVFGVLMMLRSRRGRARGAVVDRRVCGRLRSVARSVRVQLRKLPAAAPAAA
jgi:acyl-CoA synthetase (AMP-forming)/AMP-acid ligase II/uncharacterized membrane protein HdeD (DUF308 family)